MVDYVRILKELYRKYKMSHDDVKEIKARKKLYTSYIVTINRIVVPKVIQYSISQLEKPEKSHSLYFK